MKKLLSILIAVVIFALSATPALATQSCDCGHTPLVVVGGMNGFPLIRGEGTPEELQVWPPVIDYAQVALTVVPGLFAAYAANDWNKLGDRLVPLANKLLEPSSCDANGDSKYELTTTTFPLSMASYPEYMSTAIISEEGLLHSACDRLGADHVYYFNYDWRLDPLVHAEELNAMILRVKAETGHDQVDIAACSLGGSLTLAYFSKFGYGDVESCLFLSSAFSGSLTAGELLTGNISIDKTALKHYLRLNVNSDKGFDTLLDALVEAADMTGSLEQFVDFLNGMLGALKDRAIKEVMLDTLGTMPGMWSLVREGAYEQAKSALLSDPKYAALVARIDDFHYNVREKRREIVENAMLAGVNVMFTSNYEDALIPACPAAKQQSDGLIETVCTGAGATVAPLGETLPAGYTQAIACCGRNHISPDRVVDASTSMFPDQVWFFRKVAHVGTIYGSQFCDFVFWLLEQEEQPTVWTDAAHPQFMAAGDKGMTLHPTTAADLKSGDVFYYLSVIIKVMEQIRSILA